MGEIDLLLANHRTTDFSAPSNAGKSELVNSIYGADHLQMTSDFFHNKAWHRYDGQQILKRIIAASLLVFTLALMSAGLSSEANANSKYAAFVYLPETGEVLHQYRADRKLYPASLTKMMTLYMLFDQLEQGKVSLSTRMKVSRRAAGQAPSKLGLKRGSSITVKDAIFALVTKSANDVATVVAEHIGGTEIKFAQLMTKKARSLGMKRTTFMNASGLPNRKQKSTARDMGKLGKALLVDFPQYYHYFETRKFRYGKRNYKNHNNLLGRIKGVDGIKTGYTNASGFNLVSSAERNGQRVIAVVFGGRTAKRRDRQVHKLLDRAFTKLAARGDLVRYAKVPTPAINPIRQRAFLAALPKPQEKPAINALAAFVGASKTQPPKSPPHSGRHDWAIQVGAYADFTRARDAVIDATEEAPKLLRGGTVQIEPHLAQGGRLYRARISDVSKYAALGACDVLKQRNKVCLPIPPNSEVALAD